MKISSPAFAPGDVMPDRFSQYGENISPPLEFVDVPPNAESLALIIDDPDAPKGTFTHWVAYNLDPAASRLAENHLPRGLGQGRNDAGQVGYAGPKPPDGEHRYFFHLYALADRLDLPDGVSRSEVEAAMKGKVLAQASLIGRYATPHM
ncbi:MAG TPA: YbhB/YbcL family Raf kinase inhibitor-like protein [Lacunisphaera sp.]|jgi:Raf kinase inhibitor-like YbhB/YbcL family protein|nr:YbhB/YbcL family Raf kinase inhibitor-like protein [Lacunisphaera sp.]